MLLKLRLESGLCDSVVAGVRRAEGEVLLSSFMLLVVSVPWRAFVLTNDCELRLRDTVLLARGLVL